MTATLLERRSTVSLLVIGINTGRSISEIGHCAKLHSCLSNAAGPNVRAHFVAFGWKEVQYTEVFQTPTSLS